MGKIRIKTLGDEEQEAKQQEEARKRKEARKVVVSERSEDTEAQNRSTEAKLLAMQKKGEAKDGENKTEASRVETHEPQEETAKKQKKEKFAKTKKQARSDSYQAAATKLDNKKTYSLKDALEILPTLKRAKFDETVELHINTTENGVSGSVTLPHGTGKHMRIAIANATSDPKGVDEIVAKIESGVIDFDVLVATPDSMPKLARVAKVLGPRGLMPNPKNGTVSQKPEVVAKQFEAGQMSFKTEAKSPIIHVAVGKVSFGQDKLQENITSFLTALPKEKVRDITLKSTMSPGIKISL